MNTKFCLKCSKKFSPRRYEDTAHWERRKFCSQACYWESAKGRAAHNKGVRQDVGERFWALADDSGGNDACWPWEGTVDRKSGYGGFQVDSKKKLAHRVAWELTFGIIPEHDSFHGMVVCHSCDNRSCVNPGHLFLGTQSANIKDRDQKNRRADTHGQNHPSTRLTNADALEIRRLAADGVMQKDLADRFGISRGMVSMIVNRKNWTHI